MEDGIKGQCGKSRENEGWGQEEGMRAPGCSVRGWGASP